MSRDRGRTWRPIAGVPKKHTLHNGVFDPLAARRLVLCGWDAGLLVSEDGGRTWLDRTAGLPNRQIWSVAVDPDQPGRLFASPFQQPVYVSEDFGLTWKPAFFEKVTAFNLTFVPRP